MLCNAQELDFAAPADQISVLYMLYNAQELDFAAPADQISAPLWAAFDQVGLPGPVGDALVTDGMSSLVDALASGTHMSHHHTHICHIIIHTDGMSSLLDALASGTDARYSRYQNVCSCQCLYQNVCSCQCLYQNVCSCQCLPVS
jgi:hypothetical protein